MTFRHHSVNVTFGTVDSLEEDGARVPTVCFTFHPGCDEAGEPGEHQQAFLDPAAVPELIEQLELVAAAWKAHPDVN